MEIPQQKKIFEGIAAKEEAAVPVAKPENTVRIQKLVETRPTEKCHDRLLIVEVFIRERVRLGQVVDEADVVG